MADRLTDLEAFVAVVEAGSLTAAAKRLERPIQSVSRSLAAVERGAGASLVQRTTRRVTVTALGEAFHRRIRPALEEIRRAQAESAQRRRALSGRVVVAAPVLFGARHIAPLLAQAMAAHPALEIDLRLADRFVDMTAEGIDLSVRVGELPDSDLKARRIGRLRLVFFGAPAYFARHGHPRTPDELARHACVLRQAAAGEVHWPCRRDGRPGRVRVDGRFRCDHSAGMYAAVRAGLGIGFTPYWQIREAVEAGDLELVLTDAEPAPAPVHLLWPSSPFPMERTRRVIDLLAADLDLAGL